MSGEDDGSEPISGEADTVAGIPVAQLPEATPAATDTPEPTDALLAPDHPDDATGLLPVPPTTYAIGVELARGGMGRIRYGRDLRHGRAVALKELLLEGDAAHRRFEREALITARLQHPSIVPVYEAGTLAGRPFFAMKLVSGRPLTTKIRETQTFQDRLALLPNVISVCDAVGYAHSKQVVHRDIKPENILLGEFGETVLIDWGLAKELRSDGDDEQTQPSGVGLGKSLHGLTRMGSAMGTPGYMPPEQALGTRVDERSDVFALGATLYHTLAGLAPYTDQPPTSNLLAQITTHKPTPLDEIEPLVPTDLLTIVTKAMAANPADRYPTAAELAEDLRLFSTGQLVDAYDYSRRELLRRWVDRNRATVLASALLGLAALIGVALFMVRAQSARRDAEAARDQTRSQMVDMLEEQGRFSLVRGRPLQALPFLAESYRRGGHKPALLALLADAARSLDGIQAQAEPPSTSVYGAQFSADGTEILSATDRGATLRDAKTGEVVAVYDQGLAVFTANFSPDGMLVVTASMDRPVAIRDRTTGKAIATLPEPMTSAVYAVDGKSLLTYKGKSAYLWSTTDYHLLATISHDQPLKAALLLTSSHRVVTIDRDGEGKVSDANTGQELARFTGATGVVVASPDGSKFATASGDGTAIVRSADATVLAQLDGHRAPITFMTFDDSGTRLLTASEIGAANIWRLRGSRSKLIANLAGHRGRINHGDFHTDSHRIATASRDGTVKLWHLRTGKLLASLEHGEEMTSVRFAPDGTRLIASGVDGSKIWKTQLGAQLQRLGPRSAHSDRALLSPDATRLVTASAGQAVLSNAVRGDELGAITHTGPVTTMVFSADGATLVTAALAPTAILWDGVTGRQRGTLDHGAPVLAAGFADDGTRLLTVATNGTIKAWEVTTGAPAGERVAGLGTVTAAALSPNGELIAIATDGLARIANARTGELVAEIQEHRGEVLALAFSPDGARLVTASEDTTAKLWDTRSGEFIATLADHQAAVTDAAFSPDGARVVTGSADGTAKLWDAERGRLLATHEAHDGTVSQVAFTASGDQLITTGSDGVSLLWDSHLERRTSAEIDALLNEHVPWSFEQGRLVPRR